MESIYGGGFWDGVCAAFYVASATGPGVLALGPIGAGFVTLGTVGCLIRDGNK
jgi:hypothetical protein